MSISDDLKNLLQSSSQNRIADESKKLARQKVRPITYQGDRNTQELGNDIIENGVPLNNASKAIGDQMMPLAKGNVLKRIDNVNVSPALGTALRDGLEKDNASGNKLSKNGGGLPGTPNDPLKGTPASIGGGKKFPTVPPPEGCFPVSPSCVWSPSTDPPTGYQSYGSVDTGSSKFGVVYLYCKGVVPPSDLGCDFLKTRKYKCFNGVCVEDPNGVYNSKAECEAALIPPPFTGGQCVGINYYVFVRCTFTNGDTEYCAGANAGTSASLATYISSGQAIPKTGKINTVTSAVVGSLVEYYINGSLASYFFLSGRTFSSFSVVSITRVDGNPDNCGNLPSSCP